MTLTRSELKQWRDKLESLYESRSSVSLDFVSYRLGLLLTELNGLLFQMEKHNLEELTWN